jgi:predicted ABC-type ATPase
VKNVIVLGGPNGAGKTTAAANILPAHIGMREFVNADEIAQGMSPFDPAAPAVAAGRLMVERIHALARAGASFAFEITCAGRAHAQLLRSCRDQGYRVTLIFLWLPSPEAALARVAQRVRGGGHGVADEVVVRRYWAGLRNMRHLYLPLADLGLIYDNSGASPVLIAESASARLTIHEPMRWQMIEDATR